MPTTELNLRVETILELIEEVMTDLALELQRDYAQVDVKLSVTAR